MAGGGGGRDQEVGWSCPLVALLPPQVAFCVWGNQQGQGLGLVPPASPATKAVPHSPCGDWRLWARGRDLEVSPLAACQSFPLVPSTPVPHLPSGDWSLTTRGRHWEASIPPAHQPHPHCGLASVCVGQPVGWGLWPGTTCFPHHPPLFLIRHLVMEACWPGGGTKRSAVRLLASPAPCH